MKPILDLIRRWALFNKRLLKKPGFLVILLLIPILVVALTVITGKEDSGIMTVAIACEDRDDALASKITDELLTEPSLIHFVDCESPADAVSMVESGIADAAWIFPAKMQERIDQFTKLLGTRNSFVKVIQRESNILLQLSYEKLSATLFPYCSRSLYNHFIRQNFISLNALTDEQLEEMYDAMKVKGDSMFDFAYTNPDESVENATEINYLLTPMRGLMATLTVLGGLAVSLFYMQDSMAGKFDWVPRKKRFLFAAGYHMTAVFDVAVVMLLTLMITGMSVSLGRELITMLLFAVITVGFCMALGSIFNNLRLFGSLIPILVIAMIALCPVFFNFVHIPAIQYLLPPYHYLNAIHNVKFIYYMLIYAAIIWILNYFLIRVKVNK